MDISRVRSFFQKPWNFSTLTIDSNAFFQVYYSLQQESLTSKDMLLYVTSNNDLDLEGELLEGNNQRWIVYQYFKESFNKNLFQYRLFPVLAKAYLIELSIHENDIGLVDTTNTPNKIPIDVFIEEFSVKERGIPTAQAVDAFQQVFIMAARQLPEYGGTYILEYKGVKYRVDSLEQSYGIVKIRTTEDL